MKKILLLSFLSILLSCSSGNNNSENNSLAYTQVRVVSDDVTEPSGNVYLFYVSNYSTITGQPAITYMDDDEADVPYYTYTGTDGQLKGVFPTSDYGLTTSGKLITSGNGYSVHTFYWNELSTIYGTPKAGGRYIVCVLLNNKTYARAYKEFTITKNSIVTIHLPTCTEYSKFVNAEWTISDYK